MKIICDTNIWYYLGSKKISIVQSEKSNLICTYLSLYELIHTERLKTDFSLVHNACLAVLSYSKGFIFDTPFNHLDNLVQPMKLKITKSNFLDAIKYIASIDKLDDETINELNKFNITKIDSLNSIIEYLSFEIEKVRLLIHHDKKNKIQFKQLINRSDLKEINNSILKNQIITEVKHKDPLVDNNLFDESFWLQIEFFIKSCLKYYEKLKLDKKIKPKKNDIVDMINLMYVNKNCLYWTEDRRWKNIFKEANLENYLYCN